MWFDELDSAQARAQALDQEYAMTIWMLLIAALGLVVALLWVL